ncbi:conserved hypothetical protein [Histoplasma capsulatum G186AR]|uniref:Uncharacterized protein n=1 Tax=Ajellomyces capsulatus (strain G186AR / H82 / ATCC MYA-2454 / RMSCC 2432) TaxID=447093 RepID=C0P089_AJECG|nr:uncharacterized protein HCBG_08808 [Histoplasma capsulatum G186AR]EEH02905.1 conserved hypothetical protein [Histoplasma capsulatum G186AR]
MSTSSQLSPDSHAFIRREDSPPFEAMLARPYRLTTSSTLMVQPILFLPSIPTLAAAATFTRILDLAEEPTVRSAKIIGYTLGKWQSLPTRLHVLQGEYPALIDGEPGQVVSRSADIMEFEGSAQKLTYYEMNTMSRWQKYYYLYSGDPKTLAGATIKSSTLDLANRA